MSAPARLWRPTIRPASLATLRPASSSFSTTSWALHSVSAPAARSARPAAPAKPVSPTSTRARTYTKGSPPKAAPFSSPQTTQLPPAAAPFPSPDLPASEWHAAAAAAAVGEPLPTVSNGDGSSDPLSPTPSSSSIDWSSSFHGLSTAPFPKEVAEILMRAIPFEDVEIKPDGIIYLPEIKYRRILNQAFGPGGWGLAPRGELVVGEKVVTREYALVVHGRFIAQARGECQYFSEETIPTAGEGCKSNALLRCCKDLGVASELWDPRYIREFKRKYCQEVWVEHVATKKRRQVWCRRDGEVSYPYKATTTSSSSSSAAAKR